MSNEKTGRPKACANIYKNGRLKTGKELEAEKHRIMGLKFDDLLAECKPMAEADIEHLKKLTNGVEVDLDAPLKDED